MQAGRHTSRQKHTVWLFLVAAYTYKQWGTMLQDENRWSNGQTVSRQLAELRFRTWAATIAAGW